jgi:hypothetical protein
MPERIMLNLAQAVREQIIKETPRPRKSEKQRPFSAAGLRRLTLWGATAACALMLAVISSRSEVGAQRLAVALRGGPTQPARAFDAEAETRRLSDAVRGLTADNDAIKMHLAAVEHDVQHDLDDVTGSISKEIEAADAARRADDGPTVAATAALSTAMVKPASSPPPLVLAAAPATGPGASDAAASGPAPVTYGVDVGSGLTIPALRARWEILRSAHPELFAGLRPIVSVREIPRANRVELRLVVGPFAQPAAATQLCATLTPFGLFCQATLFDGQRLALR